MERKKEQLHVLVVEDDEDDFFIAQRLLAKMADTDVEVEWVQSYEDGLDAVSHASYDVCLVDYRLGAHDGLELLEQAQEHGCRAPIILLTGQGDREVDLQAMQAGAADYLVKWEFDAPLLERSIRYARERRRAEERIREQAALLDKARDAISAIDLEGRIIYWNKGAERLTGWPAKEMHGEIADERLYASDETLDEAYRVVREKGDWSGELRHKTKSGGEAIVESRWTLVRDEGGAPTSILIINTDITERKQLEAQFLQAQRMESVGRLVSGIAHDLGNLLVPILLGIKVLRQRYDDEQAERTLGMIEQSVQRGKKMVEQVLAFARGSEGERQALHPTAIIEEVKEVTEETFPEDIDVHFNIPDDTWIVTGDATQLQQVLMNLCVNARDAMPDGGQLTIQAENLFVHENLAKMNIDAEAGEYVKISVTDTGTGIPQEIQDKIFEPFFTTKDQNKGTGLGLSSVYSIVKGHGGFINVYSQVGEGTSFHVYLPASDKNDEARKQDQAEKPYLGHQEWVLVVDDEEFVRKTTRETLERAGYRVLTAGSGEEAVRLFKKHEPNIATVLTDIVMPGMDGLQTIRALREQSANVPIIAASGIADSKGQQALEAGAHLFISKPFTAEKLFSSLQELLGERARTGADEA